METNTLSIRKSINDACDLFDATFAEIDSRHAAHDAEMQALGGNMVAA